MSDVNISDRSVCERCGACCASYRVDFHPSELAKTTGGSGVPVDMALPLTPKLMRMKGTDDVSPRCIALKGEIGCLVGCRIYADRPSPCHEFNPWAVLGIADQACDRARRRHGMPPLSETETKPV
jgi:Fe-S-cluster containining protein